MSVRRVAWLLLLWTAAAGALLARLAHLQLVRGPDLALEAFRQRARVLPLELPRGDVLDRDGRALNAPVVRWRVIAYRPHVADPEALARRLAPRLGLDPGEVARRLRQGGEPFVVLSASAPPELARRLPEERIPGVVVAPYRQRYGPGARAVHVVGTVRTADNRGTSGLERAYDRWLRGRVPPSLLGMQNARREAMGGLRLLPARPEDAGADVVTTLDATLQGAVERALAAAGRPGAAVVLDAWTGDVLAMASAPAFDPSRLAEYLDDPRAPLVNRAVRPYPPGSVFKLVVAVAALETGRLGPREEFPCTGAAVVGGRSIASRCPPGEGRLTWQEALAHSSNEVFIEVARRLGPEELLAWAERLGFGRPAGTGLPEEEAGHLPSRRQVRAPGDMANLAIGQGPLTVTPVQVARLVAAVAADGRLPGVRLVREVRRADGLLLRAVPQPAATRVFSPGTARQLRAALRLAVVEGTGRRAELPGYGSAGKTGTAEAGGGRTVAWFAGYVPAYLPRYVVVVCLEGDGSGPDAAAPLFGSVAAEVMAR